jgi:hypothetical protein
MTTPSLFLESRVLGGPWTGRREPWISWENPRII